MKNSNLTIIGVIMILLGAGVLIYRGYNVTREETVLNVGPLDVKATTHERVPLPAPLGWALVIGGIVVLVGGVARK